MPKMPLMSPLSLGVVLAVLLAGNLTGCQAERQEHGDVPREATGGFGPLSATSGVGSFMMMRDPVPASSEDGATWTGSFGSYLLCLREADTDVELQSVGWEADDDAPPETVEAWLRLVDSSTEPTIPFVSKRGYPWDPSPGREAEPGDYTQDIAGHAVTQTCDELERSASPQGRTEFTELVFILTVGEEGGELRNGHIDYLADGQPYRLVIDWKMGMCGSAIVARDEAAGDDSECVGQY